MNGRVGGVIELLRHPGVWRLFQDFFRTCDGALHPLRSGGENQLSAQHCQKGAAFQTHRFRHRQNELITLGGADESESDTGVAAGGFDDHRIRFNDALACSAASIIDMPILSFTLPRGLKNSHFIAIVASTPRVMRFNLTRGVRPTVSIMLLYSYTVRLHCLVGLWIEGQAEITYIH